MIETISQRLPFESHKRTDSTLSDTLGDYVSVVSHLIQMLSDVQERDQLSIFRDLSIANDDLIRVRATAVSDGIMTVDSGVDLIHGSRDMLVAAAHSLGEVRPLYHGVPTKQIADTLKRFRPGQTEHRGYVVSARDKNRIPLKTKELSPISQGEDFAGMLRLIRNPGDSG